MSISSYSDLKSAVAGWLARGDLTARIPDFIQLAEAKFNRVLFVPQMEQRSTTSVDTASDSPEFISLPVDFQTMRRVRLNGVSGKPRLDFLSPSQIDDYRSGRDDVSGQPQYFSIVGADMELAPTPNENYTLEMLYRKNIPALSDSNTTNWLLAMAPDAYLYASLLEATPYMVEDERIPVWSGAAGAVIDQINDLGERRVYDAGPSTVSLQGVTP